MVRLGSVALIAISLPAAAWSNPPSSSEPVRAFHLPQPAADRSAREDRIGRTQIAPNTHFGFGMFGLKSE